MRKKLMTVDELIQRKKETGYSYPQIAAMCNLPLSTVQKVLGKKTKNPRLSTLQKLNIALMEDEVLELRDSAPAYKLTNDQKPDPILEGLPWDMVTELNTWEEFQKFKAPYDVQFEVIDGRIYQMASPTEKHQCVTGIIYRTISNYICQKKKKCAVWISPLDVRLSKDDEKLTVVQPDVFIRCPDWKEGKIPAFVLEVLSPSTRIKDICLKVPKYRDAGVRECMLIDLLRDKVIKYDFIEVTKKTEIDPESRIMATKNSVYPLRASLKTTCLSL